MAFDLEYMMVKCDHRIKDELIAPSTTLDGVLVEDAAVYGSSFYGDTYGYDQYAYVNAYSNSGIFIPDGTGSITAIIPVTSPISAGAQLYALLPGSYLRFPIPQYVTNELMQVLDYGAGIYYGENYSDSYGGPGYVEITNTPSAQVWYVNYLTQYDVNINGTIVDIPANSIVIKRYNPIFEWYLDYDVKSAECPICGGSGTVNDLLFDRFGKLSLTYDMNKLSQQVMKSIITSKGKNEFFPAYGTIIPDLIGEKALNGFLLRSQIRDQLENIKYQQGAESFNQTTYFTARELLEDVLGVKMLPTDDPRQYELSVTILNRATEQQDSKVVKL
jgi:hypothetical protein